MKDIQRPEGAKRPNGEPFKKNRRTWDSWVGDAVTRERRAYGLALGALAVAGLAVWDARQQHMKGQYIPYVVERDSVGNIVDRGPLSAPRPLTSAQIAQRLRNWVTGARAIYVDAAALRTSILQSYSLTKAGSSAFVRLQTYHASDRPELRAQRYSVHVHSITTLRIGSGDTWQVEWRERRIGRDGTDLGETAYRATVTYVIEPPVDIEQFRENPDGFLVVDFDWNPIPVAPSTVAQGSAAAPGAYR